MGFLQTLGIGKKEKEKRELTYVAFNDALTFGSIYNKYSAMNISAFYAATSLISNTIAMLPIKVLVDGVTGKNETKEHPIAVLFSDNNNGIIDRYTLMKLIVQSVILRGNAFVYIERKGDVVTGLRYLESGDVTITYNKERKQLWYDCSFVSNKHIMPKDMLHFVLNSYDGVNGVSLLSYAARTINITNASENSAKNFFDNGMNLNGILKVTTPISEKQKNEIRSSWNQAYNGNGGGLAIINANMEYQQLQLSPEDSQLLSSRQYNVADIARFFNLNPLLIGGESGVSYSSVEQLQNFFLSFTLQPWVAMIEAEMNRKLLPNETNLTVILETNDLLRIDKQAQANYYKTMCDGGILSRNEIRKEIGYGPFEGGDDHTVAYSDAAQNTIENKEENKDK